MRARFTALLLGRDPITTIVGVLNFLCNTLGLMMLKPANVAPASRIGDSRRSNDPRHLDAPHVAPTPSTPIHAALPSPPSCPFRPAPTHPPPPPPSLPT